MYAYVKRHNVLGFDTKRTENWTKQQDNLKMLSHS